MHEARRGTKSAKGHAGQGSQRKHEASREEWAVAETAMYTRQKQEDVVNDGEGGKATA